LPCKGEYTKLERDPCDLYNIKFCVWECIIIIGVGWGLTGGGQSQTKPSKCFSHNMYYVNFLPILLGIRKD